MRITSNSLVRALSWGAGLLLALSLAAPVAADEVRQSEVTALVKAGRILPLERIMQIVGKKYPGDLQEAEVERDDGAYIYELEILNRNSGIVWKLEVDARSGRLLEAKRGH